MSAVNGAAIGGGCAIALAADGVIAGKTSYLHCPFVKLGLVPDTGTTWLIVKSAGPTRALEILLLVKKWELKRPMNSGWRRESLRVRC